MALEGSVHTLLYLHRPARNNETKVLRNSLPEPNLYFHSLTPFTMKSLFVLLLTSFILASCITTKVAGNYDFTISGTPYGKMTGILTIMEQPGGYKAKLSAMDSEIDFKTFDVDQKSKNVSGVFYFEGNEVNFFATPKDNKLEGVMSAAGSNFPFNGVKKP